MKIRLYIKNQLAKLFSVSIILHFSDESCTQLSFKEVSPDNIQYTIWNLLQI